VCIFRLNWFICKNKGKSQRIYLKGSGLTLGPMDRNNMKVHCCVQKISHIFLRIKCLWTFSNCLMGVVYGCTCFVNSLVLDKVVTDYSLGLVFWDVMP
jgi:hypothetical protein